MDKYKGKIEKLEKLILSDPHYKKDVWCRYQKDFKNACDWDVELYIDNKEYEEKYKGQKYNIKGITFNVLLTNSLYPRLRNLFNINNTEEYSYNKAVHVNHFDIGMDSAQVAIGANKQANIIEKYSDNDGLDDYDDWRPSFTLKTLTDGLFGEVNEFEMNNLLLGINFTGWLDEDTGYSIDEVMEYLTKNLEIKELTKEKIEETDLEK